MSIVRYIPNTITSCNLLCGVLGVIASFSGRPDVAFALMLAASVFDFCDGFAARLLKAYSDMGKELDSLSDMVSFGVLPSVLLYNLSVSVRGTADFVCFIPVLIAIFSGLRLAKFNVDERQHSSFMGLATPPCALICASLCDFVYAVPDSMLAERIECGWVLPVLSIVLALLLVSEIPMFAMKVKTGDEVDRLTKVARMVFFVAIAFSLVFTVVSGLRWSMVVLLSFTSYVVINLVIWPCHSRK